ncbi:hypothetical protein ABZT12_35295, partial [Streptomyces sp. NPDC005423]
APVESLMPLRLARYGVPLTETAPSGLAAAGIKPALFPPAPQQAQQFEVPHGAGPDLAAAPQQQSAEQLPLPQTLQSPEPVEQAQPQQDQVPGNRNPWLTAPHRNTLYEVDYDPSYEPPFDLSCALEQEHRQWNEEPSVGRSVTDEGAASSTLAPDGTTAVVPEGSPATGQETEPPSSREVVRLEEETMSPLRNLSSVDRYLLAWQDFQHQQGREPTAAELSAYLARQGIVDGENQPLKAKTLARYFLQFRIYIVWAEQRAADDHPALECVVKELAQRGITAQYNKPIHVRDLEKQRHRFEHRWHALSEATLSGLPIGEVERRQPFGPV